MANHDLLAAAFTAMLGVEVVSPARGASLGLALPKVSIHQLFRATYIMRPPESIVPADRFEITVKTLTGMQIVIPVSKNHTIAEVKAAIDSKENIHPHEQRLVFDRKTLEDHLTLQEIGVPPDGVIFLVVLVRGGGDPVVELDPEDLAPEYDYDFTNQKDDGQTYMRGKYEYRRPYGWKRYAIRVLGRGEYGGDEWLGPGGMRTQTDGIEWPVSYHGTSMESAKSIAKEGYRIGSRDMYGKAVYSSPYIDVAKGYASCFTFENINYRVILQNRVNPDRLTIVSRSSGDYWLSPANNPDTGTHDVRPYNLLLQKY